jgi:hypothetical protein
MNLPGFAQLRDRLAAARVLQHRGMVDMRRPDEAARAFLALRRLRRATRRGRSRPLARDHPNCLSGRTSQIDRGGCAVS